MPLRRVTPSEDDFENPSRLTGNTAIVENFEKDSEETDPSSDALKKPGKSAGIDATRLTGKTVKEKVIRREIPMRTMLKKHLVIT